MVKFFFKYKDIHTLIVLFFLSTILISGGIRERSILKNTLTNLLLPLNKITLHLFREIRDTWKNLFALRHTLRENVRLQAQIRELLSERQAYQKVLGENKRLRKLLGYSSKIPYRTLGAEVIGYDPSNWFYTLIIDRGRRDGVHEDQAVIAYQGTKEGLVGRIISVEESWSEVLPILNQNSRVGAKVLRTQFKGVVEGQNSRFCRLKYLPYDADIKTGDTLITSGKGGIYPEDLFIGQVVEVEKEKGGLFLVAQLRPFIEFAKLEDVLVVIEEQER